eukprot:scaffold19659_cov118-Skeletonema_dohrnii-CCMP3373.AAC.1
MAIKADIMLVVLLGVGKIWLDGSTPQRHDDVKVLCVVDEKDFLQFRRARAKIFFIPFARMLRGSRATYTTRIPV